MKVDGVSFRSLAESAGGRSLVVVDQTRLPTAFERVELASLEAVAGAISRMVVRGAPLIGVTAAYGVALALRSHPDDAGLDAATRTLVGTRPTAVNLRWAVERVRRAVAPLPASERAGAAWALAGQMAEEDVAACQAIGRHGAALLRERFPDREGRPLQVLTHCNAGWLATVDWGTALAPVYRLHDDGVPVHVWVSETRPRNQGLLTAWELGRHGVPFTLVVDNAAAHLLGTGRVDCCLVGADRITGQGDVCNKIGTALKARASCAAGVPFFVAAPCSTIDWQLADPDAVPIEERASAEVTADPSLPVFNPGFDVTPAELVDRLVTERGVVAATAAGLAGLREGRP